MEGIKSGELAFLPSDITLLKYKIGSADRMGSPVDKWVRTSRPCHVLVVESAPPGLRGGIYTEVLYEGEKWMARKIDLYPIRS